MSLNVSKGHLNIIYVLTVVNSILYLFRGNHPYHWEANSSSDTALSILLNLCYAQSVRSALKEEDTFRTLVHIAEYSEKLHETRKTAEEAQMTTQCIKAVCIFLPCFYYHYQQVSSFLLISLYISISAWHYPISSVQRVTSANRTAIYGHVWLMLTEIKF